MSLGRQFENTYWEDPNTGETHTWTRNGDIPNPVHVVDPTGEQRTPLQGMLFHPLTGTGLSGDPLAPKDVRRGIIQKALDLTDVAKYRRNLINLLGMHTRRSRNSDTPMRAFIGEDAAKKHMEKLTDTLEASDMPTHIIATRVDNPVSTVLDPMPGRAWADSRGRGIRMTSPHPETRLVKSVEKVKTPSNEPIANPKFWDQLTKARDKAPAGDSHNSISADDAFKYATHWINPTTGHVMTKEFAENLPVDYSETPIGEWVENPMETPALVLKSMGYVPNLFIGKGKPESKNHAVGKDIKIETGYGNYERGQDYTYSTFHQRFKPSEEVEKTITKRIRTTKPLSEKTMTHELGHAMDPNIENTLTQRGRYELKPGRIEHWVGPTGTMYFGGSAKEHKAAGRTPVRGRPITSVADPVEEAVADATADRYTRYKGKFSDALANPETRAEDFRKTGYGIGYEGWTNNTQRALYTAVRYHTALSDDQIQRIPSRRNVINALPKEELEKVRNIHSENNYLDTVNQLTLGHIYHHMPHIHGVLRQAGLENAAIEAHTEYKKRMGLEVDQPTLPGMEKFV